MEIITVPLIRIENVSPKRKFTPIVTNSSLRLELTGNFATFFNII